MYLTPSTAMLTTMIHINFHKNENNDTIRMSDTEVHTEIKQKTPKRVATGRKRAEARKEHARRKDEANAESRGNVEADITNVVDEPILGWDYTCITRNQLFKTQAFKHQLLNQFLSHEDTTHLIFNFRIKQNVTE